MIKPVGYSIRLFILPAVHLAPALTGVDDRDWVCLLCDSI